jgi:hypothetical protein
MLLLEGAGGKQTEITAILCRSMDHGKKETYHLPQSITLYTLWSKLL